MPTIPGITVWPERSITCAPARAGVLAAGPTAVIFPWSTITVWSSRGTAPVPSITHSRRVAQARCASLARLCRGCRWRPRILALGGRRAVVVRVPFEEFDDAQHVIHALQRRAGTRQLVAD